MRLDKLLAHSGFGTRKEVKELIKKGFVSVNDETIKTDKMHVDPQKDVVKVDDEVITYEEKVYYMLNKPSGYVSATEDQLHPTVVDLIDDYYRNDLFPVGRLDIDTVGLLLLTNDDVQKFLDGITIDDYQCQPAHLTILSHDETTSEIEVEIYEGKFHQVKKMFLAVGKEVVFLKRIRMKNLELDESLALGEYRRLTNEELDRLKDESMLQ